MTTNYMDVPGTILSRFGYIYTGSCRCDGHFTEKYRKPGTSVVIKWRIHKRLFKVNMYNSTYLPWMPISKLENTLNEVATAII